MNSDFSNLLRAIESDPGEFSSMVEKDPSILTKAGPNDETLLHWLAVEGQPEAVKRLVQLGAKVDTINEFGDTPLMDCALAGKEAMVALLIELGANPNYQSVKEKNTAAHLAAESGHAQVVNLLLSKGANHHLKNAYGETVQDLVEFNRKWVKPPESGV